MSEPGASRASRTAAANLAPEVYRELREMARRYLRGERRAHTLEPTALVHEAYIRMAGIERVAWAGRTHFLATAARQMRRVLVDHARAHVAAKRGGPLRRLTLNDALAVTQRSIEVLDLERALERLAGLDARQAQVAELRLFAGMSAAEVGEALGVSERTVRGDWRVARAWLARELDLAGGPA